METQIKDPPSLFEDRITHIERLPVFQEFSTIVELLTGHPLRVFRVHEETETKFSPEINGHNAESRPEAEKVVFQSPLKLGERKIGAVSTGPLSVPEYKATILKAVERITQLCACFTGHIAGSLGLTGTLEVPNVVTNALELIRTRRQEPIELKEIAAELKISPSYLSELIKKHLGMGFRQYLNECRLHDAIDLLIATTEPVSIIAFRCGYQSLSNFNRAFKTHTGMSPSAYRKNAYNSLSISHVRENEKFMVNNSEKLTNPLPLTD